MWNGQNGAYYPYGLGYARRYISQKYSYFLQPFSLAIPPYNIPFIPYTDYPLPLSLSQTKLYLRIDPQNTLEDDFINMLIAIATSFAEQYTRRDLVTKTYLTYRNDFSDGFFVIRRSVFQQLISFQYLVLNVLTPVDPTLFYLTNQDDYSQIFLLNNQAWPNNIDCREQAIQIMFTAGYGLPESVPQELKLALLQHISQMYENRGDASISDSGSAEMLPPTARLIYNKYKIQDLNTIPY